MWQQFELTAADISLLPSFISATDASKALEELQLSVNWRRDSITLFGKTNPIPRLHQWYADPGIIYRWSGLSMQPEPWFPALASLRKQVSECCDCAFNSVLINLYRDGNDSMGWHSDNEPELGNQPVIASLSLGAERDFVFRRRTSGAHKDKHQVVLAHGSLLLMQGATQQNWQHALPRRKSVKSPRINLTFRKIMH